MPNFFLDFQTKKSIVNTSHQYSFRSNSYHKTVSHCVEYTFVGNTPKYHFGFSPSSNKRVFVSLYRPQDKLIQLFQTKQAGDNTVLEKYDNPSQTGETFLVCLNSKTNTITYVQGSIKNSQTFPDFYEYESWYAYVDTPYDEVAFISTVSVNLGFEEFQNKMPSGYSRWIYDIDGIRKLTKKKIKTSCRLGRLYFLPTIFISFII